MKNKIIAANWKMNKDRDEAIDFIFKVNEKVKSVKNQAFIFAPSIFLRDLIKRVNSHIKIGAQNCSEEEKGAFTGEISASMLQEKSVSHVLIGHSERRTLFNETDDMILKKVKAAIKSKLTPIVCIGETLSEKEANKTLQVLDSQINGLLAKIEPKEQVIVAYEPVWAIGTGLTPDENEIKESHLYIKTKLNQHFNTDIPILYGGSANSENCSQIISIDNVGGLLVGGASLKKHDFKAICNC